MSVDPPLTSRPLGRHLLIYARHPEYVGIAIEEPVWIVWNARLFRV